LTPDTEDSPAPAGSGILNFSSRSTLQDSSGTISSQAAQIALLHVDSPPSKENGVERRGDASEYSTHSQQMEEPALHGSVEKSRQRRSRHFSVLTYYAYAPRVKTAAALLDGLF